MKHRRWSLIGAVFAWSVACAQPPASDCSSTYPRARVEQAASAFDQCAAMPSAYLIHISQQRDLLLTLRPAYERELGARETKPDEKAAKERTKRKLKAFDEALERIAAAQVPPSINAVVAGPAGGASGPAGAAARASARQWLTAIKRDGQSLTDRINDVGSALTGDERAAFCEHDYVARISGELEKKLAVCLRD